LLTDYQCSIDVRNHNGIMAKDIGCWHDKIGRIFKDFYAEFDKKMGVLVGPDEDEKYSVKIAESFDKNAGNEADLFRRVVSSTGNDPKEQEEVRQILKARSQVPLVPQIVLRMQTKDHFKTDIINPLGLGCLKCRSAKSKDKKTQR